MTTAQKHAALLRAQSVMRRKKASTAERVGITAMATLHQEVADACDAGAEALEAQGRWYLVPHFGQQYMIPVERKDDWLAWLSNREPGEYTAIVPEWAVPVPDDVVITGWRKP